MQGKIVRLREIDDIALGFIFLGITALVLGVAMLIGSVSGLVYFANHGLKATTLMVNTMYNGIAFVICSGMSLLMTSMLVFTIKNEIVLKGIEYISLLSVLFTAANVIRELVQGTNFFEFCVAFVALAICGVLYYAICNIKKRIEYMMDLQKIRDTLEDSLKDVG